MQQTGSIVRWERERGFGFIRSPGTASDVFFHVRQFQGEPALGMAVQFELIHIGGKGPRAMAIRALAGAPSASTGSSSPPPKPDHRPAPTPAAARRRTDTTPPRQRNANQPPLAARKGLAQALMLGWLALLGWGLAQDRLPLWLFGALAGLNLLTWVAYAIDKNAAQQGHWRISERQLHLLALLGGWPAAWWAQQWLRHKSRKQNFRTVYWATVLLHGLGLLLLLAKAPLF